MCHVPRQTFPTFLNKRQEILDVELEMEITVFSFAVHVNYDGLHLKQN